MSEKRLKELWFKELSPAINRVSGMLMLHPDKRTASEVTKVLLDSAFELDRILDPSPGAYYPTEETHVITVQSLEFKSVPMVFSNKTLEVCEARALEYISEEIHHESLTWADVMFLIASGAAMFGKLNRLMV